MAGNIVELNDNNFQSEVLDSDIPVLVDFWAPWCPPCRLIGPMIEELAGENQGRVKVGKLDIDQSPETARRYGVEAIPTLIIFKNGQLADAPLQGVQPKSRIQSVLDAAQD